MSAPRLTFLYPFLFAPTRPATVREASRTARRAFGASSHRRQPPAARKRYGTANEPLPHLAGEGKKVQAKPQLTRDGEKPQITRDGEKPQVTRDGEKPSTLSRDVKEEDTKDDAPLNPSQGQQLHAQPEEAAKDRAQPTPAKEEGVIIISDSATTAKTKPSPPKQEEAEEDDEDDEPTVIEAMPPTGRLPPSPVMDAAESAPVEGPSPQPQVYAKPLETVLNMPPPDSSNPAATALYTTPDPPGNDQSQDKKTTDGQAADQPLEGQKPPHISTPPYVHHFDTYSLVRRLEEGGWTQEQAVTLMKAVRLILSGNMDLARNGLVSKSNVENESYLFSAACSELKTEIQTKRATEGERSRTDRTQLQHEVDILNQRMTQESATMKDELKGMFDDRKMFVRNDQRDMERKVRLFTCLILMDILTHTNATTPDPRTQLPHHRLPELRLPLRRRRRPLDHHKARNLRPRNLRRHDPRLAEVCLFRQGMGGGREESACRCEKTPP